MPHRPYMIKLSNCTRVRVQGVTLSNSPMFHLVPQNCTDVTIQGITIKSPSNAHNTDGIDPSGWNYLITDCTIDTGDDNIAVKPTQFPQTGEQELYDHELQILTTVMGCRSVRERRAGLRTCG